MQMARKMIKQIKSFVGREELKLLCMVVKEGMTAPMTTLRDCDRNREHQDDFHHLSWKGS